MEGPLVAVLVATIGGLAGGASIFIGAYEALTGRILINRRHLPWSRRDAKVIGVCNVVQGLAVAIEGAMIAFMWAMAATPFSLFGVFVVVNGVLLVAFMVQAAVQVQMSRRTGLPLF